jgi:succinate-semialdehyde dehydrogenase/glutarate-semialdehyde dehydrogenase
MELGGNAPFIVFDDADLDLAVEAALVAKLRNTGASCIAANRFYVHDFVADDFTDRFSAAMARQRVDSGFAPGADVGALVSLQERDKVSDLVDIALDAGARTRTGGEKTGGPGAFYRPTVLDEVRHDNPILATEIFGPVAPVVRFAYEGDVIRLANDSSVGLMSYVITRDLQRGLRVAEALESGMVSINRGLISDPAAPFGGVKRSGLGKEGGHEGIEEYVERKYVGTAW